MNIDIKPATAADAATIALLARITFGATFGHLFRDSMDLQNYYQKLFAVEKIRNGIAKAENLFWLATMDELPVGYAKLKLNSPTPSLDSVAVCQLQKIYILADVIGTGVGRQLQEIVLNTARDLAFQDLWLSVLHSNERALRFYKKNGYQEIGSHDYSIGKEDFHFKLMHLVL